MITIFIEINFKNSLRNLYELKPINNYSYYNFTLADEKKTLNKFLHTLKENKKSSFKFINNKNKNSVNNLDKINGFKSYKYLDLAKFNSINSDGKTIDQFIMFYDENKNQTLAHIQLVYSPDSISEYKIININLEKNFSTSFDRLNRKLPIKKNINRIW